MLRLDRVLKPFRTAGSLNEHIALWGFVTENIFLTKGGDVGVALEFDGVDPECLDPQDVDVIVARIRQTLRLFDSKYRVYQYQFRRRRPEIPTRKYQDPVVDRAVRQRAAFLASKADELFDGRIYFVILFQALRQTPSFVRAVKLLKDSPRDGIATLAGMFSTSHQAAFIEEDIEKAAATLLQRAQTFVIQLVDLAGIRILNKQQAFSMLRRLVNVADYKLGGPALKYDTHLDYFICDSTLAAHPDCLMIDDYYVRLATLKEPPSYSRALILQNLTKIHCNYHLVTEWHPIDNNDARGRINSARRHFHQQKMGLVASASDDQSMALVDDSKYALVAGLSECLVELDNGNYFGEYALTVVVYDKDRAVVDAAMAGVYKAVTDVDGSIYEETYNQLNAFFATIPGGYHQQLRKLLVSNVNAADYSLAFAPNQGAHTNPHLGAEYLAVLETQDAVPYFFNIHHEDLAHTLVLGKTGAGKSFLLNFLAVNAQKYHGYTYFFDLGGSFRGITKLFGGRYLKVSATGSEDFKINPFSLPYTDENRNFLFQFLRVLIEGRGGYELNTAADEREVYQALDSIYQLPEKLRTLSTFASLIPRHISERLHKWLRSDAGQYAWAFDNDEDTLITARMQTVDFEGLDHYPDLIEPLLFYLLHRANSVIYDPMLTSKLKLFFIDEAWRFFSHPVIRTYIVEALKTWRKKNAGMILSTQSMDDLLKTDILNVLVESCSTKIFLAIPKLDEAAYREAFRLSDAQVRIIGNELHPKSDLLLVRPNGAKVLTLSVDPLSYWLYTNDTNDNVKRDEMIARHGFERGLELLAQGVTQ
jgi:type IV secretion system protein VirB4